MRGFVADLGSTFLQLPSTCSTAVTSIAPMTTPDTVVSPPTIDHGHDGYGECEVELSWRERPKKVPK